MIFLLAGLTSTLALSPAAHAKRQVTDQLNRTLTIPDYPRRIVALAPSITEILFSLKQEDRLVGATQFSDYPEAANRLPKVGSYVNLDVEKIVSLKPDLCIAVKDGNPIEIVRVLENLGIPIYAVNPRNLESVMHAITEIGTLLNAEKEADQVVLNMEKRISRVKALVSKAASRPRVFYQIGISPIVSAGSNTCIDELIEMAGGENLAKGPAAYPRFSTEQILALSPEIFIITSMTRGAVFEAVKSEWQQWTDMPAVKNNRIVLVDSNLLDRPTPRLVDGLEMLLELIHPELFEAKK
jgi:iron complex transport system substrate-binding protein